MIRLKKMKNAFQVFTSIIIFPLIGIILILNYLFPTMPSKSTAKVKRVDYLDPILEIPFQEEPDTTELRKNTLTLSFNHTADYQGSRRRPLGKIAKRSRKYNGHFLKPPVKTEKSGLTSYLGQLNFRNRQKNKRIHKSQKNWVQPRKGKKDNIWGVASNTVDHYGQIDNIYPLFQRKRKSMQEIHGEEDTHSYFMNSIFPDAFKSRRKVNWKEGGFCRKFLLETFQRPIKNVCKATKLKESVECFGNYYSGQMGACILHNVAIFPPALESVLHAAKKPGKSSAPISLLNDAETNCKDINSEALYNHMESGDYIYKAIKLINYKPVSSKKCTKWINNDVYLLSSNNVHIYFRFLDYFNLHKLLEDYRTDSTEKVHVIQVSESNFKKYLFPKFDQQLFPEASVYTLKQLGRKMVCFKRIVLVPRSYASFPFRCKMSLSLKRKCFECAKNNAKLLQLKSFRKRVLKSCSVEDKTSSSPKQGIHNVVFISRKKYKRFPGDNPYKFKRILMNEKAVVSMLQSKFSAKVKKVQMEKLGVCEQVKLAHSADLLIGVHGAGLVHLWWLRNDSLLYEIEPFSQTGNPSFSMLAELTGHHYMKQTVHSVLNYLEADVIQMKTDLSSYLHEDEGDG